MDARADVITHEYKLGRELYRNPLSKHSDVEGYVLEGDAGITFPLGRMRLENLRDPAEGQRSNFVFWCPVEFPEDILVEWDVWLLREPGLCMTFFSAMGRHGGSIFDSGLEPRIGEYHSYNNGDINAFHISYFRRKMDEERAFHTCNLRKSKGFHLVSQGADPIPDVADTTPPYRIRLAKYSDEITFWINELPVLHWHDDGVTYGPPLGRGYIGFRQMAPLIAEYANLGVWEIVGQGE